MSKYSISEKALEDINAIWNYTAERWSTEQANRYYNLILDEIEFIAANSIFKSKISFSVFQKDKK